VRLQQVQRERLLRAQPQVREQVQELLLFCHKR
jgi:hypothetical protein